MITREGSYKAAKDTLQIELKKGRKETNHPSETVKTNLELSTVQPISFELIYKESLNGFMKNDKLESCSRILKCLNPFCMESCKYFAEDSNSVERL